MAKIWYVKKGPRPNNSKLVGELSLDRCIKLFADFELKYLGTEPPEFTSDRNNLTSYRCFDYVVVEVDNDEATQNKSPLDKKGFFFVCDLTPDKARNILEQNKG